MSKTKTEIDGPLPPFGPFKKKTIDDFERKYLTALMKEAEGSVLRASRISLIDRTQLYRMLRRLGLIPPAKKDQPEAAPAPESGGPDAQ